MVRAVRPIAGAPTGTTSSMLREPIWWVLWIAGVGVLLLALLGAVPGWIGGAGIGLVAVAVTAYRKDREAP
jgi:hypothetical protein